MNPHDIDQTAKAALDGAIGVTALVSPVWLSMIEHAFGVVMAMLGMVLLVLRLMIAWREWRSGRNGPTPPS